MINVATVLQTISEPQAFIIGAACGVVILFAVALLNVALRLATRQTHAIVNNSDTAPVGQEKKLGKIREKRIRAKPPKFEIKPLAGGEAIQPWPVQAKINNVDTAKTYGKPEVLRGLFQKHKASPTVDSSSYNEKPQDIKPINIANEPKMVVLSDAPESNPTNPGAEVRHQPGSERAPLANPSSAVPAIPLAPEVMQQVTQEPEQLPVVDALSIFANAAFEESETSKFAKTLKNVDIGDLHESVQDLVQQMKGWR
jgi:hypothetical protein